MNEFTDKYGPWALVTGASSGIGEEFAHQLAARGLNLVLTARSGAALDSLAVELRRDHQVQVETIAQDLAATDSAAALVRATEHLEIGLLVNNAGMAAPGAFVWQSHEQVESTLAVNMRAPTLLSHYFARAMARRGRGGIILVASTFAYQSVPYFQQYAASKAYLLALGEAISFELGPLGVDVTVLSPGPTKTRMQQMEGMDFAKMPLRWMPVAPVVRKGIAALGRKRSVIPGFSNRFMAWMGRYMAWRSMLTGLFGRLMLRGLAHERRGLPKACPAAETPTCPSPSAPA